MKTIFFLLISCTLIISCNENAGTRASAMNNDSTNSTKNISSRDRSITSSNSYSDLFLDTSMVENFLKEKKVPDSIASRIRSFYNTRNYQYAWFSSDGLTEQARGFWNLHDY